MKKWKIINVMMKIENCTAAKSTEEIHEAVNMVLDATQIPDVSLAMFTNMFKNQILAVTVTKRQVDIAKFPEKWEEARMKWTY